MASKYSLKEFIARKKKAEKKDEPQIKVGYAQPIQTIVTSKPAPLPEIKVGRAQPTTQITAQKPLIGPVAPKPTIPVVGYGGTKPPRPLTPKLLNSKGMAFPVTDNSVFDRAAQQNEAEKKLRQSITGKTDTADNLLKGAVRALPRAAVSVSSSIAPVGKGKELVPVSPLAKFVFGEDPIGNVQQEGEKFAQLGGLLAVKYAEKVDKINLSDEDKQDILNNVKKYKWLTLPLGLLTVGSDLVPGVGGARKQASKEVTEQLIKKYGLDTANEIVKYGDKVATVALEADARTFIKENKQILKAATESRALRLGENITNDQALSPSRRIQTGQSQRFVQSEVPTQTSQLKQPGIGQTVPSYTKGLDDKSSTLVSSKLLNTDTPSVTSTIKRVNDYISENKAALKGVESLELGVIDPSKKSIFNRAKQAVSNTILKGREVIEDSWIRGKKLVEQARKGGVEIDDTADFYQREILMHGRIQSRMDDVVQAFDSIDKKILKVSKELKVKDSELFDDVQDYLVANHAIERNKVVENELAAGISDNQAREIIDRINSSGKAKQIKEIASLYRQVSDDTLDILKDGQLITEETYNKLKSQYKNHIPLQRIFADGEDFNQVLAARGNSVKKSGLIKAKGSTRQIADVRENLFANISQAIKQTERNRVNLSIMQFARENKDLGLFEEIPFFGARKEDPSLLFMFENGKHKVLKINDPHLAAMMRGLNVEQLNSAIQVIRTITRLYAGLNTRFNPEFIMSNKFRDIQEMVVFMSAQKELGAKSGIKSLKPTGSDIKSVYDYLKGSNTEGARLYRQMKLDGGTTGGMGLSTKSQVEATLKDIYKANRKITRKSAQKLLGAIDNLNIIFEDSTRLTVYKEALSKGLSRDKAAALAKEATINFNKMGTAGPVLNALYMFSNASIQGSAKMLRALRNPKVFGAVVGSVTFASWTINKWNDSVDPDWRDKVNKWDKTSNLTIALPSDEGIRYITIPISWGLKPIKVMADSGYDLAHGKSTPMETASSIAGAFIEAYNPVGGTDIGSALTPTVGDLPVDIWRNRAWHGGKIRPDSNSNAADVTKYFKSQNDTLTGRTTKRIADYAYDKFHVDISPANMKYAYEQLIGGAGRAGSRVVNTVSSISQGESPEASEIPFVNRFYKTKAEDEIDSGILPKQKFYEINARISKEESVKNKRIKEAADAVLQGGDAGRKKLEELKKNGELTEDFIKELKSQLEDRQSGLTDFEISLKKTPLASRGEYIYQLVKDETPEKRLEILKYLQEKKLLTKSVMEAVLEAAQKDKK